jgi:hypothetical protein
VNHQATRIRIWSALARFANTDDSLDDYHRMARMWPNFWPLPVEDGHGNTLAWKEDAQPLFNFYRDVLRRFWVRDPVILKLGRYTELLFGTLMDVYGLFEATPSALAGMPDKDAVSWDASLSRAFKLQGGMPNKLVNAVIRLKNSYPKACPPFGWWPIAYFWPDWNTGIAGYRAKTDFQCAVWNLFRQSWRAKVCARCSAYFIADKPAQSYCSTECSNQAHLASAVRWWKEKGASRRAQRKEGRS